MEQELALASKELDREAGLFRAEIARFREKAMITPDDAIRVAEEKKLAALEDQFIAEQVSDHYSVCEVR